MSSVIAILEVKVIIPIEIDIIYWEISMRDLALVLKCVLTETMSMEDRNLGLEACFLSDR